MSIYCLLSVSLKAGSMCVFHHYIPSSYSIAWDIVSSQEISID